jgi:hypothetical protein
VRAVGGGVAMSYEAWRREVANGTMADWNEDRNGYDPAPEVSRAPVTRLWDRQFRCWVRYYGALRYEDLQGPNPRYSRTEDR